MNVRWEPFSGIQQRGGQLLRRRRLGRGHAGGCPEEPLAGGAVGGEVQHRRGLRRRTVAAEDGQRRGAAAVAGRDAPAVQQLRRQQVGWVVQRQLPGAAGENRRGGAGSGLPSPAAAQQNGGVLQAAGTEDIQQAVQQGKAQRQDGIWRYVYLFCQRQEGSIGADAAADAGGMQLTQPPNSPASDEIALPHRQVMKGQTVHVDGGNIRFLSGSYVNKHGSSFRRSSGADRVVRPYKTR